jgi:GT2 family glycosyltransferase
MDEEKVDLSIVVVTWNAKKVTEECLESIERQDAARSLETIVVDNASSDGTVEMVQEKFPSVRLVQNDQNLGFAKANNSGIRLSTGKYICLINSDVNVPPSCLRRIYCFMEENPSVGLLGPRMLGADGKTRRSCMRFPTLWSSFCRALGLDSLVKGSTTFGGFLMSDFKHDRVMDVEVLNGWFWVVRREALEQVGLLDERFFMYGEDVDWCYRFRSKGWRTVFYPEAEAIHYGGASSARAPARFYVEMHKANVQYWRKHHGRLAQFAYLLTVWLHEVVRILGYAAAYLLRKCSRADAAYKVKRSVACIRWLAGREFVPEDGVK